MIIENMRFIQREDGLTEIKFRCSRCGEWIDEPAMLTNMASLLTTKFWCRECFDAKQAEVRGAEEARRNNMTLWQKFVEFWK